jgi:hypothetical protein
MKKHETFWQVIQDIHIIQEGGCNFSDEHLLHEFINDKRKEFPDCKVKVYHEFWVTEHCSLMYEKHLQNISDKENEEEEDDDDDGFDFGDMILRVIDENEGESSFPTKGDC